MVERVLVVLVQVDGHMLEHQERLQALVLVEALEIDEKMHCLDTCQCGCQM